jgi:hypothetical protein
MKSIEDRLYCFCGGGASDTGGGSAGDFDDSYNQAMGYTETMGGTGYADEGGQARQATAEERARNAANYESEVQAAADAQGGDLSSDAAFAEAQAREVAARNARAEAARAAAARAEAESQALARQIAAQQAPTPFPGADTPGGPVSQPAPDRVPGKAGTVTVAGAPFVSGGRSSELAYSDALARSIGATPQKDDAIAFGDTFDVDVTDPANIQGMQQYGIAAPTSVTQQAGVQQVRDVTTEGNESGSPNDIRNRERVVTDFDDITLSQGPGVPKQNFVQDTTPLTEEEKKMAENTRYFNRMDLNKDGTVDNVEMVMSGFGYGPLGYLSDVERRMNIGPVNADGTAAIPGRDFDYERTGSGAIDPNDPNYMGPDYFDYEGGAGGTQQGAYFGPARTEFGGSGTPDTIESLTSPPETGGNSDENAPAEPPARDPCPDGYKYNESTQSCEYVGQSLVGGVASAPAPIQQTTQYTGVAGLQPFVLQPTYTAPTTFSPTYTFS